MWISWSIWVGYPVVGAAGVDESLVGLEISEVDGWIASTGFPFGM